MRYFNFSSNNTQYICMWNGVNFRTDEKYLYYARTTSEIGQQSAETVVYASFRGWLNQAYRTIILEQPATGDLLTFLQANATKIS